MKGLVAALAVLAVAGLAFFLYFSPTAPPEMTEAEIAQIEAAAKDAIAERWIGLKDALLGGDTEGFLSFWTQDMRILEPGMDLGKADFDSLNREFWESGAVVTRFELQSFEVFVHADAPYQVGQYDESFQFPGEDPTEFHRNFFSRWEKGPDGVWRLDRFVSGPVEAPPEG